MKFAGLLVIIVLICSSALFSAGFSNLEDLKNLSRSMENDPAFQAQFMVKADPDSIQENILFETFDYMQKMSSKYPDAISDSAAQAVNKLLQQIQDELNSLQSADPEQKKLIFDRIDQLKDQLTDKLMDAGNRNSKSAPIQDDSDFEYCDSVPSDNIPESEQTGLDYAHLNDSGEIIQETVGASKSAPVGDERAGGVSGDEIAKLALAVSGKSGKVVYGTTCYTAATQNGVLACAAVVSAILKKGQCVQKINLACVGLRADLKKLGWQDVGKNYDKGEVVYWTKSSGDRPRHTGILVQKDVYNKWWTVDNSSGEKKVLKRPLIRSYYPVVLPAQKK
ncbi:MAG: hypothetical protein PHW04_17935 [Candidatus Wallbacteria bacterium]|nr:hypothetical protein [Candidatus Wallbacteria bacterium]